MTTTTTARAEIYDIAVAAGFAVQADEGVERIVTASRGYRTQHAETVTRFIISRSADARTRMTQAGVPTDRIDEEFTVLFKENDSFSEAWGHRYGYLSRETPWRGRQHSSAKLSKADLIKRLEQADTDRLIGIYETRKAERLAQAQAAHEAAIQAHHDAVQARDEALEDSAEKLRSLLEGVGVALFVEDSKRLLEALLDDPAVIAYGNAETRIQTADRNRDAKAAEYNRISGQA